MQVQYLEQCPARSKCLISISYYFLLVEKGSWDSWHFRDNLYWYLILWSCRKRKINHIHTLIRTFISLLLCVWSNPRMSCSLFRTDLKAKVWVSHMDGGGDQGCEKKVWAGVLFGTTIWAQGTEVRRTLIWLEVRPDPSQDLFGKWWKFHGYTETGRLTAVYTDSKLFIGRTALF